MNLILKKYAELLLNFSLKMKLNEKLLIVSTYLSEELIKEIYKLGLKIGINIETLISLDGIHPILYENAAEPQLQYDSELYRHAVSTFDAVLRISAPFNLKELQNANPEKKKIVNQSGLPTSRIFKERAARKELRWSYCLFPTSALAQEAGMSLDEYRHYVYDACFLFAEDPVAEWTKLEAEQKRLIDILDRKKKIRFFNTDTDLTFSTENRRWINSIATRNVPSGEIFTSPVENAVNGKIRFNYPIIYMGEEIEDVTLEVTDGLVVRWDALKGKKLLDRIFEIEGARRFGEAAIGNNFRINRFTKNILLDEKIGGSIHMAVGSTYPETGGKNESVIHIDFIADMKTDGKIYADDELIYEKGQFLI